MTSVLAARDELAAALETGTVQVAGAPGSGAPPVAFIFGDGVSEWHLSRNQFVQRFRVTLVAGGWDVESSGRILTGLVQQAVLVILGLSGWRLEEVRRDNVISIAGGQMLGADVIASRMVDIS